MPQTAETFAKDDGYAPETWAFDAQVTAVFDNMLERSIPQYPVMRQACVDLACGFIQPDTDVVDLGCSRGEALAPLIDRHAEQNRFVGVEVSPPMLEAARARFAADIAGGSVAIEPLDLRTDYPEVNASVTLCVLTLQFTPIEYRAHILRRIWESTVPGGALILVEKVLGSTAAMDAELVRNYYALKRHNGYAENEIERKRLSLEGRLVPVTAGWNEELLRAAGFVETECFWRWMNFAGWVAVRR